jgi:hypothetical protein
MPVFLAYVRTHNALEIGEVMLVTGVAQLASAPIPVVPVRRFDERVLSAFGFVLFAVALGLSAFQTRTMFWPQLPRGCAIMFCILPPTQLALGQLAKSAIADASGLFNMMRNLGGAIGIAETVLPKTGTTGRGRVGFQTCCIDCSEAASVLSMHEKCSSILSPGALSNSLIFARCKRATAATRLRPSPLPGVVRLLSSR